MTFNDAAHVAGMVPANGLNALEKQDKKCIKREPDTTLVGSANVDADFLAKEPNSNRWDYVICGSAGGKEFLIWVEPHSATSTHEITTMLNKFSWIKAKLATEPFQGLKELTNEAESMGKRTFWWVTSGKIGLRQGTPQARRLSASGLNFPIRIAKV